MGKRSSAAGRQSREHTEGIRFILRSTNVRPSGVRSEEPLAHGTIQFASEVSFRLGSYSSTSLCFSWSFLSLRLTSPMVTRWIAEATEP